MPPTDSHPTTLDLLESQRDARGDEPALLSPDRETLTYAALHALIANAGGALAAMGFARGHRIAVALPDGPDAAVALLAAATWTTCAPLDPRLDFDACALFLAAARIDAVATAAGDDSPVTRAAVAAGLPVLSVAVGREPRADFIAWRSGACRAPREPARPQPDDIALVMATSGTTARPKIVPITHQALVGGVRARPIRHDDRCLCVSPLHTLSGLGVGVLGPLAVGASTVLTPGFDAARFFEWLNAFRPTYFSASPTVHAAIIDAFRNGSPPLPDSLRFVRSSSSGMTAAMQAQLEALLRVPVIQGYGSTECGLIAQDAPRTPGEELVAETFAAVLAVPQVGARDNFFDLGGDSLRAVDVLARLCTRTGIDLDRGALFETPTVEQLAARLGAAAPAASATPDAASGAAAPECPAVASFGQEQLWLLDQILPDRSVYNETWVDGLTGALDAGVLARALGALAARHEALRTRFAAIDGEVRQVIVPAGPFDLPIDDLSSLAPAEREAAARRCAEHTIAQPFDLEGGPPMRARLLRLAPDEHWLAVAVHHIVFDRWSSAVFMRELSELYAAIARGEPSPLPALPARYADHARWQREHLTPATLERLFAFWQRALADLPALELPTDRPRPAVASFRGGQFDFAIDEESTAALRALARKEKATPFMALLAAFQVLLHRYTGQEDFAVGTPMAGRGREEVAGLIGFFVNMLVMRCDLRGDPSFSELLGRVRRSALDVYAHADLPFEKLVERLAPSRDLARNPLFQVSLRFGNTPNPELRLPGIAVRRIAGIRTRTAKFDLAFAVNEVGNRLTVRIEYSADLFDAPTIERMAGHFLTLLRGILANPARRVSRLPLLTPAERQRELVEWNDTATVLPSAATIASLFAAQVARAPEATAVVRGRERLTYAELDVLANRLAHRLRALGAGPEATVAVLMPRSIEWTVALMGIMKAEAAYVPLDPELPAERLAFLLTDTGACALVVQGPLAGSLPSHDIPTLCVDGGDAALAAMPDTEPPRTGDARALAYVIHTSGSSGEPKGVMIEQRALVNHLLAMQARFSPGPADCVLQTASIAFDQSIWQVLFPLLAGGRVALPEFDTARGGEEIAAEIRRHEVTILRIVPTLLATLVEGRGLRECPSLRAVIVAGEVLDRALAQTFAAQCDAELVNAFGPTEATFVSLLHTVARDAPPGPIPIGRPLGNMRAYVLDRYDQPVPVGVPGELCIAGASVGRGYRNRADLSTAAFARDPFAPGDDARMYRTGDIVRRLADGNLDFIGRRDRQVKLRGVRLELGEIEAALAGHPAVAACAAALWRDAEGEPRLAVHYVGRGSSDVPASELQAWLARKLPAAIVPRIFLRLPALPLTPSGKVDRQSLQAPPASAMAATPGDDRVGPRDPVETSIAAVWTELLGLERVDIHQNFFDAGGHSLLAMRLLARIEQLEGVRLRVRDFFEAPDIASLARCVVRARTTTAAPTLGAIARERDRSRKVNVD